MKYNISKADGSDMDKDAWYFVLRVDEDKNAQHAAREYAHSVGPENPTLADELLDKIATYDPNFKLSSEKWQYYSPYKVLDPDGWPRRGDFNFSWFEEEITYDEYKKRMFTSTLICKPDHNE